MWRVSTLLVGVVFCLCVFGLVMLTSTSAEQAEQAHGTPFYFVVRQGVAVLLGFLGLLTLAFVDYRLWRYTAWPLLGLSILLLLLVWAPGIGKAVKGSHRWLAVGPVSFQPSELAKLAVVVWLATWMDRMHRHVGRFSAGFLIPAMGLGVVLALIFAEPDFGTTVLLAAVGFSIMFAGGTRFPYLLVAGVAGAAGIAVAIMHDPVRMRRILAFLNPEKYAEKEAFQLLNAIYAFVAAGWQGVGLGESLQKRYYLPEAHTDFIFAIIGEELGIIGSLGVTVGYLVILLCGLRIAARAPDHFGRLLAFGITILISLQAVINIAVVTGCMPTKGLPLPFISYGGTSMVMALCMVGILVNVARSAARVEEGDEIPFVQDAVHEV